MPLFYLCWQVIADVGEKRYNSPCFGYMMIDSASQYRHKQKEKLAV